MVQCKGCSNDFPFLEAGTFCSKCKKKTTATKAEWKDIDTEATCKGCGVIFPFLALEYCGACKIRVQATTNGPTSVHSASDSTNTRFESRSVASRIISAADAKEKDASSSRLGQKKPASLQIEKNKLDMLRRANKSNDISIEAILYYWPKEGNNARRVQMDPFWVKFALSEKAEQVLHGLLDTAQLKYGPILAVQAVDMQRHLLFAKNKVNFSIVRGNSHHSIDEFPLHELTLEGLVSELKGLGLLTAKAEKENKLTIRITVRERHTAAEDFEEPQEATTTVVDASDSDSAVYVKPRRAKSVGGSALSTSTKRKRKLVGSGYAYASNFQSAFRKAETVADEALEFNYEVFQFRRKEYHVDETGITKLIEGQIDEEIEVVKGWRNFIKGGKPAGGYLSKGFSKYAFRGRFNGEDYALFQCIPASSINISNEADLLNELKLLVLGQYFTDIFYQRAAKFESDHLLPAIAWNVDRAFVGRLVRQMEKMGEAADDNANLFYTHFLATPLLPIDNALNKEVKFCGNNDVLNHRSGLGAVIDAFIHATLIHSHGQFLFSDVQGLVFPSAGIAKQHVTLFDPQAHTLDGQSGHWDRGRKQIVTFMARHQCNQFCYALELGNLQDLNLDGQLSEESDSASDFLGKKDDEISGNGQKDHPLRIGF